jgi:hypothetical protein
MKTLIGFQLYLEFRSYRSTTSLGENKIEWNVSSCWSTKNHSRLNGPTVNLTFMGPCIANVFQYISNKMQLYTVYLYLETALHVSGVTSTHHQERIQLHLQHLVFVHTVTATCRCSGR